MSSLPGSTIIIDAFSCTLCVQILYTRILEDNFDKICKKAISLGAKPEFSASRYLRCIRVIIDTESNGAEKILWIQICPISPHDPAIRFELKGHPFQPAHWKTVGKILRLLTKNIPIDIAKANVTRIDIAIDVKASLDEMYCHKLRTKVANITFANSGSLACLRFGKSTSNSYLCVYGKDWTESRASPRLKGERVRFEYRFKPRVPLGSVIENIKLEDKVENIFIFDRKEIKSEGILNSSQLSIADSLGITPLILSVNAGEKRTLLRKLKAFRKKLLSREEATGLLDELQSSINGIILRGKNYEV